LTVNFYGSRRLLEQETPAGRLEDCRIADCDISGLEVSRALWTRADIRDVHAEGLRFLETDIKDSSFFRSNFTDMDFTASAMTGVILDSLTLIRSRWRGGRLKGVNLRNLCLQRAAFRGMRILSSSFTDFEAIKSEMENCVVTNSRFVITYGSGMNGYSGASFRGCLFQGCRFEGRPLEGAFLEDCLFVRCWGDPGDPECRNVAGLGNRENPKASELVMRAEAAALLARFSS
jgi:uncharacterized protein YjbI with pentapeptide repeats